MRAGLDNVLINLDIGMPGALWRVALGILLGPTVEIVHPGTALWMVSGLLAMLLSIKVVGVVARRALLPSDRVRSHWEWRRDLARYYDSYQWRKMLWFGIGIVTSAALGLPGTRAQWVLGVACVAAGGTAEILWRRHKLGVAPATS
jgi:hypothetical protein